MAPAIIDFGEVELMKIAVFGATGFVGRQLVPHLQKNGHQLLVVGRQRKALEACFPNVATTDYASFDVMTAHFDIAINLATINSDAHASLDEFQAVNRDMLISLAQTCHRIGVKIFLNVSSVHALDQKNDSAYAQSKREGANALTDLGMENYLNIYLPSVHGEEWAGKLGVLNRLPKPLAKLLFAPLAALKPTVSVGQLVDFLEKNGQGASKPIIVSDGQHFNRFYHITRRVIDVCFAFSILFFFWWLLLALWIAIRLDSSGPAIFAQRRVGEYGKEFTCYKFRTMRVGTAQRGTHEVASSSVTKVGKFLRKYKLDELPQIWNLLKNEMSLIGPRPCLPNQVELVEERKKRGVLKVKPGISGFAQIRNIDMSDPVLLADADATYIGLRGLVLDLKIALQTALGGGSGDKIRH